MKYIGNYKVFSSENINKSNVSIGFECLDRDVIKPERCYDLLAHTGVKYARCQTGWAKCEKEKGVYDFSWLDSIVDNLLQRGVIPWFNVGYGNPLYMPDAPNKTCVGCVPILYGDEAISAWKSFVTALAKHFVGRITHFEIWNEPDLKHFWYPGEPSATQYARLINISGACIRSVIANAKIGSATNTYRNFDYIKELIENVSTDMLDFFSYHAYAKFLECNYCTDISLLRELLDASGFAKTELWQGESGFPSLYPENYWLDPKGGASERAQAVWQLRRYFLDVKAGASLTSFFQIADMWEKPYEKAEEVQARPAAHGILNGIEYTPKKSYKTISHLANFLSGDITAKKKFFETDIVNASIYEKLSVEKITLEKDVYPVYAYYIPAEIGDDGVIYNTFNISVYNAENTKPISNPVLFDMLSGELFEIDEFIREDVLIRFTNLPITDYPIVIADRILFDGHINAQA